MTVSPNHAVNKRDSVGLPLRAFLYTLEQISTMTAIPIEKLESELVYYDTRTLGVKYASMLMAHNAARPKDPPLWRVSEDELIRWLRAHGFYVYERKILKG